MALLFLSTRAAGGLLHTAAGCSRRASFGGAATIARGGSGGHRPLAFSAFSASASLDATPPPTELISSSSVNGVRTRSFHVTVPLDHSSPTSSPSLRVFVREVLREQDASPDQAKKTILYLQGGPGFPAARPTFPLSGWMASAVEQGFRILLLDQRGTGMSEPITPASLQRRFADLESESGAAQAAEYLSLFRADSIVRDCEAVRAALCEEGAKLSLLGQSFGGFCILTYLSLFPGSLERCCFTFGLAPVLRSADEVYEATFRRMATRNRRFYERYPGDARLVKDIARHLQERERGSGLGVALPSGGVLTLRRFAMSGLALGSADGYERLHFILEDAWSEGGRQLSASFLKAMDELHAFETNPVYWLLHEAIYCDGPGASSRWAAHRVRQALDPAASAAPSPSSSLSSSSSSSSSDGINLFDAEAVLRADSAASAESGDAVTAAAPPLYLSGEMVYPWMGEGDFQSLGPLRRVAELLAQKEDWPALYDAEALRGVGGSVPCAALISYDDIYVERAFSEETADLIGCKVWVTNEFQHSGLRDCPKRVFETLLAMTKGEVALPS